MPPLNKDALSQKFQNLNSSQQAIEGLSSWCLFYRKETREVVSVWEKEFMTAPVPLKTSMLYVANHLMQESRKRGREFIDDFFRVLPRSLRAGYKTNDPKLKKCMSRLVDVWDERKVFGSTHIKTFKDIINGEKPHSHDSRGSKRESSSGVHPLLHPVTEALQYVESANQKSSEAMSKSLKGIREGLVNDGTAEELRTGLELLVQYSSALENEIAGRKHMVHLLRNVIVQQEDSMARNDENLRMCALQKENVERRLALLLGAGAMGVMHSAMSAGGSLGIPTMGVGMGAYPGPGGGAGGVYQAGGGGGGGMGFDDAPGYGYQGQALSSSPTAAPLNPIPLAPTPSAAHPQPPHLPHHPSSPPAPSNGASESYSPQAIAPDSPMPPPMSPADGGGTPPFIEPPAPAPADTPAAPMPVDPLADFNPEMLAELASKLANSTESANLFAQALSGLPQDEQNQVLGHTADEDDAPYDPDHPY